jgi:hypothetical protein
MTTSWSLTARLLQVLARHLRGYIHVATTDAALLAQGLQRRILAALVALVSSALCLLLGTGWIVASVWNTPWRAPVLTAMLVGLAACAIGCGLLAVRPFRADQKPFAGLRREFDADTLLINEASAEDRLRTSRAEAAGLLREQVEASAITFPRSMLMRLLLNMTGLGSLLKVHQHTD